jgi:flagellar biosynthetic protein FliO
MMSSTWIAVWLLVMGLASPSVLAQTDGAVTGSRAAVTVSSKQQAGGIDTSGSGHQVSVSEAVPQAQSRVPSRVEDDPESRPLKRAQGGGSSPAKEDGGGLFLDVLGKLAMVVALIFVCAAVWRKLHGSLPQNAAHAPHGLQVVSSIPLGAQRFLHVVAAGGRQYLIGSSAQNITLLALLDESSGAAPGRSEPSTGYSMIPHDPRPTRTEAAMEEEWDGAAGDEGDRFEELLLRLRRLEAEHGLRERAGYAVDAEETYRGGGAAPRTEAYTERRATSSRESRSSEEGAADGRSIAPGSLFRSAPNGARGGRHG